jgi:spermidine/putrescine-binding protein
VALSDGSLTRADLLKVGAAGGLGLTMAGPAFGRSFASKATTLNMLTWSDHYANDQLKAVNDAYGADADAVQRQRRRASKIKQTGSQFDIVSGDALWVPKYHKDGLTSATSSLASSKQLY